MKLIFFIFLTLDLGPWTLDSGWAQETQPKPLTLAEFYQKSLERSENIASSAEALAQAQALYWQALGSYLPEISFRYQNTWQDQKGLDNSGNLSAFTTSPQTEASFRARQTIFSGYKELATHKMGLSLIKQREQEHKRVQQLLLLDAAQAFYGALQAQANAASTQNVLEFARQRLTELQERERLGRSRDAEVVGMRYQLTKLESAQEQARQRQETLMDLLEFLAGEPVGALLVGQGIPDPKPLIDYLPLVQQRPDVMAKKEAVFLAKANVRAGQANHLPKIDLTAASYTHRPPGFRRPIDWDLSLNLEFPLWSWGATHQLIQQTQSILRQQELALQETQRQAELDIRNAYRDLTYAQRQLELRRQALNLARQDYDFEVRDYRRGLVTNLEVLESMDRLHEAELALNNARLELRLTWLKLEIASGRAPQEILQ